MVNITQHPDKGIGRWTAGELAYLPRTGIRPDGRYLPPWMVKTPHLSDEDLASLIAYLHSDDPAMAPADVGPVGVTRPSLLAKVLTHTVMKPLLYPDKPIVAPPRTDRVGFGRHLTANDSELRAWLENPLASKPDTKMPAGKNIIAEKDNPPLMA